MTSTTLDEKRALCMDRAACRTGLTPARSLSETLAGPMDIGALAAIAFLTIDAVVLGPSTLRSLNDPGVPPDVERPSWWWFNDAAWRAFRRTGPSAQVSLVLGGLPLLLIDVLLPGRPPIVAALEVVAGIVALGGLGLFVSTALWAMPKWIIAASLRKEPGLFEDLARERNTSA